MDAASIAPVILAPGQKASDTPYSYSNIFWSYATHTIMYFISMEINHWYSTQDANGHPGLHTGHPKFLNNVTTQRIKHFPNITKPAAVLTLVYCAHIRQMFLVQGY